jgi:hypothetical protein
MNEVRMRQVRLVHLHEVDAHEKWLGRTRVAVEKVQRSLFDIGVQERNADNTLLRCVDVFAVDLELFTRWLSCVARQRPLGHPLKQST